MIRGALMAMLFGPGLFAPAPAASAEANWLRAACADGELYYSFGACAGYLMAVAEAAPDRFCVADGIDYLTIGADAQRVMAELPVATDETSASLAAALLDRLYPCA